MAREMKDSGIEWFRKIPVNWKKVAIKRLFEIGRGRVIATTELSDFGYPVYSSQTKNNGVLGYIDTYDYDRSQLTWTTDGANAGTVFLREGKHNCTNVCGTLMPISETENDLRFLKYIVSFTAFYHKRADINGFKIMNNEMAEIIIILPPLKEQHRIADFLDNQCAHIDSVIEKTRSAIEEYKKLKQAVITQAVTKGIRPNREMKDSGIEWFPVIPMEWTVSRVSLHYDIILGKMLCQNQLNNDYTLEPYYCAANVHFDGVSNTDLKQMWFSTAEKEQYLVKEVDLLVVEGGAGAGGSAIVISVDKPTYIQNSVMIGRPKNTSNNCYLRYLLEFLVKEGYIEVACNKATIPHFTKDKLANVPYLVSNEQSEIVAYLDEKTAAIDSLVQKKEQLITELEAYKKSLIYEYVTGKKEVV